MRVYDCDECGETISAADDNELLRAVRKHFADQGHEEPEDLDEQVEDSAYDATDA